MTIPAGLKVALSAAVAVTVGALAAYFLGGGPALTLIALTALISKRLNDPRFKAWRARRRQYKQDDREARAAAAKLNS